MHGDFTRSTFDPNKHYSSVRMQQGRVQLDADWNEQLDIEAHYAAAVVGDVVGQCGAPLDAPGFAISNDPIPVIGPGRCYVDGTLCENERTAGVPLDDQADLPVGSLADLIIPAAAAVADGAYIAYLDVWQRHITALEDDAIREVALGNVDTTTRTKTIWQVKLLGPLPSTPANPLTCASDPPAWQALLDKTQQGLLSARAEKSGDQEERCLVPPSAGYRRIENQLYRVEVHAVDGAGVVTSLKWSRDNGSVVTRWLDQKPARPEELIVSSIGRDDMLKFGPGQFVEVIDDQRELRGQAGILARLDNAEGQVLVLDAAGAPNVKLADFPAKVNNRPNGRKARRWDGVITGPDLKFDAWLPLEEGVEVRLENGKLWQVGDYWLIPARTATADVEWPRTAADPAEPIPQPPAGIQHHYCKLAILNHTNAGFAWVQDCRSLFPPLTQLTTLLYVGGDGQQAMPNTLLPQPLRVRVLNGQTPVIGALVQFQVTRGGGLLSANAPVATTVVDAPAGLVGIAECTWTLGAAGPQAVTAALLDAAGRPVPGQVVQFNAGLNIAANVAYDPAQCANLAAAKTVQEALDILCQLGRGDGCCVCVGPGGDYETLDAALADLLAQGQRDICLCLLPGDHKVPGMAIAPDPSEEDLHIYMAGCGPGSRLLLQGPLMFRDVAAVVLRDLAVEATGGADAQVVALAFDSCAEVTLAGCHLSGATNEEQTLLHITAAERVWLDANVFDAAFPGSLDRPFAIFTQTADDTGFDYLPAPFAPSPAGTSPLAFFLAVARGVAAKLASEPPDKRRDVAVALRNALDAQGVETYAERLGYLRLIARLPAPNLRAADLLALLLAFRRIALRARPGTAIVLEQANRYDMPDDVEGYFALDPSDGYRLDDNEILGVLSLYGWPAPIRFIDEALGVNAYEKIKGALEAGDFSIPLETCLLGTLHLHGNQLTRVTVSVAVIKALRRIVNGAGGPFPFDLFRACLWGDNVFDGPRSFVLARHLTLHDNDFVFAGGKEFDGDVVAATVVAETAIYSSNHASADTRLVIQDVTLQSEFVANLGIALL